jgi:hypothetical protein
MEKSSMKKVSRKKEAPPLPDGRAKDCATDRKRVASIEPPTTAAKPLLTDEEELQQAFLQLVKEGVLVDSGRRRPDRNGRMCIIYVHRNFIN